MDAAVLSECGSRAVDGPEVPCALRALDGLPVARSAAALTLPRVPAPSLAGLAVPLPEPEPWDQAAVQERFLAAVRRASPRRERLPGERLAAGDEVDLGLHAEAGGRVLPFTARVGWSTALLPTPEWPGLAEGLVGRPVGSSAGLELGFPASHPVASLKGVRARVLVDVERAFEVHPLEPAAPGTLARLGRGCTVEQVLRSLAEELEAERRLQAQRRYQERLLVAAAERLAVAIPEAAVDAEAHQRWLESEQPALKARGLGPVPLAAAAEAFRADPAVRAEARSRMKVTLALRALVEAAAPASLEADRESVRRLVASLCSVSVEALERQARALPEVAARLEHLALHLTGLDLLMRQVLRRER